MALVLAASVVAFLLSSVSGGGAGLLLLPVLALRLGGAGAPAALTVGTAVSSASKLALFRKSIRWSVTRRFVPPAIPGVLLGTWLLRFLDPVWLEIVIGLFLVSNLAALVRPATAERRLAPWVLGAVGLLAGFVSGLTGAVGVLFNKIYFDCGLRRDEVVATRAANEVLLHLLKLGAYAMLGLLSREVLGIGAAVAAGALVATFATKRVLRVLPEVAFRRVGYGAMILSGLLMLGSAATRLRRGGLALDVDRDEIELSGPWRGVPTTLEFEWNEGLAVERPIRREELTPAQQATVDTLAAGRRVVKLERVWRRAGRSFEVYVDDGGKVTTLDFT